MFKNTRLSGSFGKNKQDAEADDVIGKSSDCEMSKRIDELTKDDYSINSETPLRLRNQDKQNYMSI
jgi:hypothetical protein